ncbi:MAG: CCA tRNA nucleotidyltransferase [Hyphomicrobiaceae bacterium]|nr:CCA tRNA nucleotidyltransferase [Hyphomicrobiaceae bacterium]
MTESGRDASAGLPSLAGAAWLASAATRAVLSALATAGHPARIVGGAVRNTLMGLPVADIDIATPARPDEVLVSARKAGLHCVPTGLQHGTVTVVAEHRPIEVTTLRRDIETDGRRATVAFTDDWEADARRRDFTINALYCDAEGRIYDPVGGYPDLVARRVRFIGDADQRIAEDYLRILRFFRFHAAYAAGRPDTVAMAACARALPGMARLSAERIRAELVKLMIAPGAGPAISAMMDIGLLTLILGAAPRPGVLSRLIAAERELSLAPDAMLRLSALAVAVADDIPRIANRLRLSSAERHALLVLDETLAQRMGGLDEAGARRLVYRKGPANSRRHAAALLGIDPGQRSVATLIDRIAREWPPPHFPVAGADLLRAGIAPGPRIGQLLAELERWWIDADFPEDAAVQARLAMLLSGENGRAQSAATSADR